MAFFLPRWQQRSFTGNIEGGLAADNSAKTFSKRPVKQLFHLYLQKSISFFRFANPDADL
jgi:hypothetical protein